MPRRTKIVATIGPASSDSEILTAMIDAGMDMARVSLSHNSLEEALTLIDRIATVADSSGRHIGILADLPGPKVRAASFGDEGTRIPDGTSIRLEPASGAQDSSSAERIAIDNADAALGLRSGDRVVLGDGAIELLVSATDDGGADAEVITGGVTQGRPGVSVPTGSVELSSPTDDDLAALKHLCDAPVDMVAVSFVRQASDIDRARSVTGDRGPGLMAKIETPEAVDDLDAIVAGSDAVMVARGDLGIRCALEDIPHFQKKIIHAGVAFGRPVITATQMLESMVHAPVPTRAEVTDVTTAVFDGTSAVMLSGETAIGRDPVHVIQTMGRIAARADDAVRLLHLGSCDRPRSLPRSVPGRADEPPDHRCALGRRLARRDGCRRRGDHRLHHDRRDAAGHLPIPSHRSDSGCHPLRRGRPTALGRLGDPPDGRRSSHHDRRNGRRSGDRRAPQAPHPHR